MHMLSEQAILNPCSLHGTTFDDSVARCKVTTVGLRGGRYDVTDGQTDRQTD